MKKEKNTFNRRLVQTVIYFVSMIFGCGVGFAQSEMADTHTNDQECIPCVQSFENGIFFKMHPISDQQDSVGLKASSAGMEIKDVNAYIYNEVTVHSPVEIWIEKVNLEPVKVKYSLYTFNKEYTDKKNFQSCRL